LRSTNSEDSDDPLHRTFADLSKLFPSCKAASRPTGHFVLVAALPVPFAAEDSACRFFIAHFEIQNGHIINNEFGQLMVIRE
jgi:hypothetical protein